MQKIQIMGTIVLILGYIAGFITMIGVGTKRFIDTKGFLVIILIKIVLILNKLLMN